MKKMDVKVLYKNVNTGSKDFKGLSQHFLSFAGKLQGLKKSVSHLIICTNKTFDQSHYSFFGGKENLVS